MLDFIPDCIRRVQEDSGEDDVTLVGYCIGGMLSTIYVALHPDGPVKNLVVLHDAGRLQRDGAVPLDGRCAHFDVDRLVDTVGIVPRDMVVAGFDALRPAAKVAGQLQLWDNLWNDEFVKGFRMMDRWGNETLPLPGEYFRQTVKELLRANALYEGELKIGGRQVDLAKITVPFLHVIAQYDHIVPPAARQPLASRRLARQGGGDADGRPRQHRRRRERDQADVAEARFLAAGAFDMSETTRTYPRTADCGGCRDARA